MKLDVDVKEKHQDSEGLALLPIVAIDNKIVVRARLLLMCVFSCVAHFVLYEI